MPRTLDYDVTTEGSIIHLSPDKIASETEKVRSTLDPKLRNRGSIASEKVNSEQGTSSYNNAVSSFGYSLKSNDLVHGQTIYGNSAIKTIDSLDPSYTYPSTRKPS